MKMEVEIGVMQMQAKERLEPQEARTGKEASFLEPPGGLQPCLHLDFELVATRTVR